MPITLAMSTTLDCDSIANEVDVRSDHRAKSDARVFGRGTRTPAGLTRRYWWITRKARAEWWSSCKLAPDLEPSPFYAAPSRPCSMDADVEKYNVFRAACENALGWSRGATRSNMSVSGNCSRGRTERKRLLLSQIPSDRGITRKTSK